MLFPRSLLILIAAVTLVRGEDFTPEGAAVFALRHNKDLLAARHLIAEAEGRLVQAGLWNNPEFELRGDLDLRRNDGDRIYGGGFMQRFPWSGRLAKARAVARVDVAMAIEELRDKERLLAGSVLAKARALLVVERKLRLNDENRELLDRIYKQTGTLMAAGKATAAEARVIELEQTMLALVRETLVVERAAKLAELNGLLGRAPDETLSLGGALPPAPAQATLQSAATEAVSRRPDRQLAALQIDKSQAEQRLAKVERWEDLGVGAGVTREREDGMYDTMVGLTVSVPLPLWNRNQGRVAETQAAQQRATAGVEALDLAIATEIREAQARVTGLASVLTRTRGPAVDLARQTTKLNEETYAAGTGSFLTVFESRKQRLAIEQAAIDTEEQLATAITDWETRTAHFPTTVRAALASEGRRAPKAAPAKSVLKPTKIRFR
jgi:cobalt-zinc-cadmium efflux system outer membrane protein